MGSVTVLENSGSCVVMELIMMMRARIPVAIPEISNALF